MRKVLIAILLGVSTILVVGCGNDKGKEETKVEKENENKENEENEDKEEDGNKGETEGNKGETEKDKEDIGNKVESKIEEREFKLYLFDKENLREETIKKKVKIEDKALIKGLTEALKGSDIDEKYLKLPKEVDVKEAKIKDGILTVNFSKDFIKEMPLGSATESGLIYSMVNTYGDAMNVSKVRIEFNGEVYTGLGEEVLESGYFEIK